MSSHVKESLSQRWQDYSLANQNTPLQKFTGEEVPNHLDRLIEYLALKKNAPLKSVFKGRLESSYENGLLVAICDLFMRGDLKFSLSLSARDVENFLRDTNDRPADENNQFPFEWVDKILSEIWSHQSLHFYLSGHLIELSQLKPEFWADWDHLWSELSDFFLEEFSLELRAVFLKEFCFYWQAEGRERSLENIQREKVHIFLQKMIDYLHHPLLKKSCFIEKT